ncbi:translocation and assembly module lipoprotein TamL [Haloflavibacter putidus]|uniref:BamA/TamA family outer membrane protein n=1 Tax=Haloflavibacter putidus TaxID=2576776 RepID=A0A507ZIZ6_9FLAO|nr:BamA/TamA family outer membrane protein [Haloflavibacter putidus]TQD37686.1 BamA/TamA family outer membrane protein [Haloflavibacter putidus]
MKLTSTKIALFLLVILLASCNAVKRVGNDEHLLTQNTIFKNGEKISDSEVYNQLFQKPNVRLPLVRMPLRLFIYNMAKPEPDSTFYTWLEEKPKRKKRLINFFSEKQVERMGNAYVGFNNFLKETGEAPTIFSEQKTENSANRLKSWYWNHGWFNAETDFKINKKDNKRATVDYYVKPKQPYIIDSISSRIPSSVADSIYQLHKKEAIIKDGQKFETNNFETERERLTTLFRNNGLYHFEQEYVSFDADTINTNHKVNIDVVIADRRNQEDSTAVEDFNVHRISQVNIFTDYRYKFKDYPLLDSAKHKGYNLYSFEDLKFKPKAITDAVFIKKGNVYRDRDRSLTYRRFNELQMFEYPNIQYMEDPRDSTKTSLITNIFLTPKPKFGVDFNFDVSRSNIQEFGLGFGGSLLIRNIFGGAEILEIGGRGSIGNSKDAAKDKENTFFNISEIGGNLNLTFPKIAFPIKTTGIIPKSMSPFTNLSVGFSTQKNIGLDKQNVTGKFAYRWYPSKELSHRFELLDLQYVRNLNVANYFNIYRNSYDRLNEVAQDNYDQINPEYFEAQDPNSNTSPNLKIPEGTTAFINDFKNNTYNLNQDERSITRNIIERKDRLTEDNLILASNFSYMHNTRENIYDEEFSQFRFKIEAAGNTLSLLAPVIGLKKNRNDNYNLFGVQFSQYAKIETDFIKHWDLGQQNIIAVRALAGIAIPYGNSNSIPFARSFFAGGANDNRGWQAYDLGPGSSGSINEFNEANMKLSFNAEYRFNLFGSLHSAVFVDVGNIWNVLDNVEDPQSTFTEFADLKQLAVGSGFGLRYDLDFFVIRLDLGFKTYNPAYYDQKWFTNYNFAHAVYNVGINYPF